MTYGCPVITSNRASMPEVGGHAAFYVDPDETEEITSAIVRLAEDRSLRESLAERGIRNAGRFSWADTAAQTRRVYNQVLCGP